MLRHPSFGFAEIAWRATTIIDLANISPAKSARTTLPDPWQHEAVINSPASFFAKVTVVFAADYVT